jgi:hypothetical protein
MEQHLISLELGNRFDSWSSELGHVELSDDYKRAIIEIPLMHYGPNKKGLFWTTEMLKEVTPMFQGVTFRYDLNGQEGSSHTIDKLSSPHFDVGWTYSDNEGAWYDPTDKILYVKGEVTHPQVVEKLQRATTDGKREVNYASMGVVVEEAICSICGSQYGECEHERLKEYDGHLCYKVPTKCSKGLHVALTNDPADGEADIKSCIFQEFGVDNMEDKKNPFGKKDAQTENKDNSKPVVKKDTTDNPQMSPNDTTQANKSFNPKPFQSQISGGLAPSSPQTAQPGTAPSSETILRDLAERIKTIEQKIAEKAMKEPQPEVINAAPQDQMMQDGMTTDMGNTEQFGTEDKMDVKAGQVTNASTPVNPAAKKAEMQEMPVAAPVDPMAQVMQVLNQILAAVTQGKTETQDVNSLINANKGQFKNADENMATEHLGEGAVGDSESEGNKKNKENMLDGSKVAIADMQSKMDKLLARLEIADNDVPEFGGSNASKSLEVADMSADARAQKFGDYGKYDAIFNGAKSASRFMK